jgi:hypothetical protein
VISSPIDEQANQEGSDSSPPSGGEDEGCPEGCFSPADVRCRIPAAVSRRSESSIFAQEKDEIGFLKTVGFRIFEKPRESQIHTRGKEHSVIFDGSRVFKYLTETALVPIVEGNKLGVRKALPSEYLERLELMNEHFSDDVRIEGIMESGDFVTSQSRIEGKDPSEKEISEFLSELGWKRIPANQLLLPHNLMMGTAWVHQEGQIVMVDARPPNFKKTCLGEVLPIDLMLIMARGSLVSFIENLERS